MADIINEALKNGSQQQIESLLENHFFKKNADNKRKLELLSKKFKHNHYIRLENFMPFVLQTGARGETSELLNYSSSTVSMTDSYTNEALTVLQVSQTDIEHRSCIIPALYYSQSLRQLLSLLTASEVIPYSSKNKGLSITYTNTADYCEGWHCVEQAYQLVWFIEAPRKEAGGAFEYIVKSSNKDLISNYQISKHQIQQKYHKSGDAFLLNTDACLQRFSPFSPGSERVVINMSFANGPRFQRT